MKIVFILPSLKGGGAERVIVTLANGFKKKGNEVYLLLINDEIAYSKEIIDGVRIVNLGSKRVLFSIFGIKRFLNEAKPDITDKPYFLPISKNESLSTTLLIIGIIS